MEEHGTGLTHVLMWCTMRRAEDEWNARNTDAGGTPLRITELNKRDDSMMACGLLPEKKTEGDEQKRRASTIHEGGRGLIVSLD